MRTDESTVRRLGRRRHLDLVRLLHPQHRVASLSACHGSSLPSSSESMYSPTTGRRAARAPRRGASRRRHTRARAAEVDRLARRAHLARRQPPLAARGRSRRCSSAAARSPKPTQKFRLDVAVDVPGVVHVLDRVDHLQREQRHRRRREALVRRRAAHLRDVLAESSRSPPCRTRRSVAAHLDEARDGVGVGELAQDLVLVDEHRALLRLARQFYGTLLLEGDSSSWSTAS